jgi:hypothetical protein
VAAGEDSYMPKVSLTRRDSTSKWRSRHPLNPITQNHSADWSSGILEIELAKAQLTDSLAPTIRLAYQPRRWSLERLASEMIAISSQLLTAAWNVMPNRNELGPRELPNPGDPGHRWRDEGRQSSRSRCWQPGGQPSCPCLWYVAMAIKLQVELDGAARVVQKKGLREIPKLDLL